MAEHDPAAFELIFLSETAWCCLHWRQLCVHIHACVRACMDGVQSCRTRCSLQRSQSSYSVYVFVSAWWRRRVLLRPNESICIQGAFFLLYAGGSKRAGTWESVQRWGGSGSVFPKQTSEEKRGLVLNSPRFFFSTWNIGHFQREGWGWKPCSHTLNPPALFWTENRSCPFFSEGWEQPRRVWHWGRRLQYSLCSRRVAAADVLTSEWPGTLGNLNEEWMEGRRRGRYEGAGGWHSGPSH